MNKANRSQFAILGLLMDQPLTGYDIKKITQESTDFFWQESFGHLYPTLNKMVTEGLITKQSEETDGARKRILYSITPTGKAAFQEWLLEPIKKQSIRNELLLKIFFGEHLPINYSIEHIETCLRENQQRLLFFQKLSTKLQNNPSCSEYKQLTLAYGKQMAAAHIQWCKRALEVLQQEESVVEA